MKLSDLAAKKRKVMHRNWKSDYDAPSWLPKSVTQYQANLDASHPYDNCRYHWLGPAFEHEIEEPA